MKHKYSGMTENEIAREIPELRMKMDAALLEFNKNSSDRIKNEEERQRISREYTDLLKAKTATGKALREREEALTQLREIKARRERRIAIADGSYLPDNEPGAAPVAEDMGWLNDCLSGDAPQYMQRMREYFLEKGMSAEEVESFVKAATK